MLQNIPTHVIAGPLGAGKTTLIRHLLTQRPAQERWAVLINEFGLVGIDAALLATADDGIAIGEVAGGCLCCVNGAPFQVGLGRLLRRARPHRLFIEPSGLGHPLRIVEQLGQAPWCGVLAVQPLVMVLDARARADGLVLPDSQREALAQAGLVIMNKSSNGSADLNGLSTAPLLWSASGEIEFGSLPRVDNLPCVIVDNVPAAPATSASLWLDKSTALCLVQQQADGWSIGWRWHPQALLDTERLEACLRSWPWQRAKMVIHSRQGWVSANLDEQGPLAWRASEWRRDSRLELIFSQAQDRAALEFSLREVLA